MRALIRCASLDDVPNAITQVQCDNKLKKDMIESFFPFSKADAINNRKLSVWVHRQKVTKLLKLHCSINGKNSCQVICCLICYLTKISAIDAGAVRYKKY